MIDLSSNTDIAAIPGTAYLLRSDWVSEFRMGCPICQLWILDAAGKVHIDLSMWQAYGGPKAKQFMNQVEGNPSFTLRYADGSAFLRAYLSRVGFLDGWRSVVGSIGQEAAVFEELEARLNLISRESDGGLGLFYSRSLCGGTKEELKLGFAQAMVRSGVGTPLRLALAPTCFGPDLLWPRLALAPTCFGPDLLWPRLALAAGAPRCEVASRIVPSIG